MATTYELIERATSLYSESMRRQMCGGAGLSGSHRRALDLDSERRSIEIELKARGIDFDPEDTCSECGRHVLAPCGNCPRKETA